MFEQNHHLTITTIRKTQKSTSCFQYFLPPPRTVNLLVGRPRDKYYVADFALTTNNTKYIHQRSNEEMITIRDVV